MLTAADRRVERILLKLRLREGLPLAELSDLGAKAAAQALADGLLETTAYRQQLAVLTRSGRLLADAVVRDLVD